MTIQDIKFKEIPQQGTTNHQWAYHGDEGSITVLDRLTGFGYRDTETGYRSKDGEFWLASGSFDIRDFPSLEIEDAIQFIKDNANLCKGL